MTEKLKKRYLFKPVARDLRKKMVFLSGPRQVGKTTFARRLGEESYRKSTYLNWDNAADRRTIHEGVFPIGTDILLLDEVHKYRQWKNHLKGIYDTRQEPFDMLITGSARLDVYRKGGDSLMGRYFNYRLHPLSLAELLDVPPRADASGELSFREPDASARRNLAALDERGGFPEPFFSLDPADIRRWRNNRVDRLIAEDVRDVEMVRSLSDLQVLSEILPHKVGSLFSINALVSELEVTHKTAAHWVDILERFYFHYRIYPYTTSAKARYLKKEPKLYLWDWSGVESESARFENMIASHLLKFAHYIEDVVGYRAEVRFVRDRDGNEIDFVVLVDKKPWFAVEAKLSDTSVSQNLRTMKSKLKIPYVYQVVKTSGIHVRRDGVDVISADKFLTGLA